MTNLLSVNQILKILDDENNLKKKIEKTISNLNKIFEKRAIHISHVASGYRFQAKPGLEEYISKLKDKGTNKFSKSFFRNNFDNCLQTACNQRRY